MSLLVVSPQSLTFYWNNFLADWNRFPSSRRLLSSVSSASCFYVPAICFRVSTCCFSIIFVFSVSVFLADWSRRLSSLQFSASLLSISCCCLRFVCRLPCTLFSCLYFMCLRRFFLFFEVLQCQLESPSVFTANLFLSILISSCFFLFVSLLPCNGFSCP